MNVKFFLSSGVGSWIRFIYFYRFVRKYVPRSHNLLVLDAGFGNGGYIAWLGRYLRKASLVGYDTSVGSTYKSNFELANKTIQTDNVKLLIRDLKKMQDRDVFDVIYSIDVLEHVPNNETVIKNIYDALKEGGIFYLAMPYDKERPTLLPAIFFKKFKTWATEEHIGEMRSLCETEILLKKIGFSIRESQYTFGFFAKLAWELEQCFATFPGSRFFARFVKPALNTLATTEFVFFKPVDGNILIICRK